MYGTRQFETGDLLVKKHQNVTPDFHNLPQTFFFFIQLDKKYHKWVESWPTWQQ